MLSWSGNNFFDNSLKSHSDGFQKQKSIDFLNVAEISNEFATAIFDYCCRIQSECHGQNTNV